MTTARLPHGACPPKCGSSTRGWYDMARQPKTPVTDRDGTMFLEMRTRVRLTRDDIRSVFECLEARGYSAVYPSMRARLARHLLAEFLRDHPFGVALDLPEDIDEQDQAWIDQATKAVWGE